MQKTTGRSRIGEWGAVLGLLAAFVLAFVFFHDVTGLSIGILTAFPIIAAAWFWGVWGGLAFTLLVLSFEGILSYLLGFNLQRIVVEHGGLLGILVSILISLVVGRLGEVTRRNRQEATEHVRFMMLLNEIVRTALEAQDMPTLLKVLADRIGELFAADDCFITLWDEAQLIAVPTVAYGSMSQTYSSVPAKAGERTLTGSVLEAGHALAVEDIFNTPYIEPEVAVPFPNLRSALGLPLISGERKMGAVILGYGYPRCFSKDEIEHGEMAARQISLAMTKVLLLEESQKRVRELAGVNTISQTFTLHRDYRQTYGQLTKILANLMGIKLCILSLYDPVSGELCGQSPAYGLSDELASAFHYPARMAKRAWNFNEQDVFRANSLEEVPAVFLPLVKSFGVECVLVAPLWDREHHWIGTIFAANKAGGFSEEDARLMKVYASQVAVVILRTQLLSAERRRTNELSVLHDLATATAEAEDEDELIEHATRLIGERLYPDNFGLLLLDKTNAELSLHSSYRLGEREEPVRIPLGVGITGSVARSGKPRRVGDVGQAPDYLNVDPSIRSELCVPLKLGETVIGVVNAESRKTYAFTDEDEDLMTIMASQLATAIQRLRTAKGEHYQAQQLERSNALIRVLAQLGARAAAAADPDGVMQMLGNELTKLGLHCVIALLDGDHKHVVVRYNSLTPRMLKAIERIAGQKMHNNAIPLERLFPHFDAQQGPVIMTDPIGLILNLLPAFSRQASIKIMKAVGVIETTSVCHMPLVVEGESIGILWLWGEGLHENDLPTMSLFATQVATALQNAKLLDEVRRLAITDALTGIYNRRHFFDLAEIEFSRAKRYNYQLSALVVDIDHFKQFNDRYGHAIGDQVLREVSRLLQASLRESDILARYGGEEFSILLPVTDLKAATFVGERLLSQVANVPIPTDEGDLQVQLSVGVAGIGKETPTLHALINRADQAMYLAKKAGRNRVAVK